MTDNKIINQWKHERELAECVCSYFVDQVELSLVNETIDLINRQQTEIEALKKVVLDDYATEYDNKIKSEAVKEFADKAKEKMRDFAKVDFQGDAYCLISESFFDNLVKEMVGDEE